MKRFVVLHLTEITYYIYNPQLIFIEYTTKIVVYQTIDHFLTVETIHINPTRSERIEIKKYKIASNAQSTILASKERFIKDTKEGNYSVNLTIKIF